MGEYFTPDTDFESSYTKTGALYVDWEHGMGEMLDGRASPGSSDILGYVDWKTAKIDEMGLWVERVLDRRNYYMKYIEILIDNGLISNSSSATVSGVRTSKGGEITKWPLDGDTLTVMPMEPRMMTSNVISAVKALHISTVLTDDISDDEAKALQKKAFDLLVGIGVDEALTDRQFGREPTEMEKLYERAAIGIMNYFQNNERIKSCPVRIADCMPASKHEKDGKHLVGRFTNCGSGPQVLLKAGLLPKKEYRTFLHEVGHFLDEKIRGDVEFYDTDYCIKSTAREAQADEYQRILEGFAYNNAWWLLYGGSAQVKTIPIRKILEALA